MSLKETALSGMGWTFFQQFATQGILFLVSIILARLLLPAEFGLIAMIGILVAVGNALIDSGLSLSLIRTVEADEEDFSTVFYFNLAFSIFIYAIVYFTAPYVALFYNQPILLNVIRIYGLTFIINSFSTVQTTRLTKLMDFKTQLKVSLPALVVSSIVGIGMAYSGYGVWSLVFSAVVRSVLNSIQLWFWSKWTPLWSFSIAKFKYHIGYGSKFLFSSILDIIFNNAYAILIGKYFAPAQIGYYNRADTLQQLPVLNIANVLNKVTFPLFVKIQDDDVRLKMVYSKIMKMVIFLVAPVLIIMAFLGEPLFRFLFTEKWLPAVPYFQILCVNGILFPIHSYNLAILKVKGYSSLFLKLEVVKKIMIVCIVAIGFQFGIYGLLYGGVVASLLAFFINTHYSGKFINYSSWSQIKDLVPTIFMACLAGLGAYSIDYLLETANSNDFFRLMFGGITGVAVYLGIAFVFQLDAFKEVKSIIFKR